MRLPRFRFTVRGLMVAVAIAGLTVAVYGYAVRRSGIADEYRGQFADSVRLAAMFADLERGHLEGAADCRAYGTPTMNEVADEYLTRATGEGRRAAHHRAMASKYRLAALLPWLPVAPDPPEPA